MRTVLAEGNLLKGVVSVESGSNLNGIVPSRPVVVVAACVTALNFSCGIKKIEVQPAPSMRKSTKGGFERDMVLGMSLQFERDTLRVSKSSTIHRFLLD